MKEMEERIIKMIKMVIFDDKYNYGGVTTHINHMCEALSKYPVELTLVVANKKLYENAKLKWNVELIEIVFNEEEIKKVLLTISQRKIAIINLHASADVQEIIFRNKRDFKIMVTGHGVYDDSELEMLGSYFQLLIKKTDLLINVSLAARLPYIKSGMNAQKSRLIYNAAPNIIQKNNLIKRGKKKLVYVGRLSCEKGVMFLIELGKWLKETGNINACIDIWGEGPIALEMKEKIEEYNIGDYCRIKGFTNDIEQLYGSYEALILPSQTESCSYTILEAMKMGLLVIASNVEGNRELVIDGITGYLINCDDINNVGIKIQDILLKDNYPIIENAKLCTKTYFSLERFGKEYFQAISSL